MSRIINCTQTATNFLRKLAKSPHGLEPDDFPSPTVMRRWLRRPGFRVALESLNETLQFQADLQLTATAARAVKELHRAVTPAEGDKTTDAEKLSAQRQQIHSLLALTRMSNLNRFRAKTLANAIESANQSNQVTTPWEVLQWLIDRVAWYLRSRDDNEQIYSVRHKLRQFLQEEAVAAFPRREEGK